MWDRVPGPRFLTTVPPRSITAVLPSLASPARGAMRVTVERAPRPTPHRQRHLRPLRLAGIHRRDPLLRSARGHSRGNQALPARCYQEELAAFRKQGAALSRQPARCGDGLRSAAVQSGGRGRRVARDCRWGRAERQQPTGLDARRTPFQSGLRFCRRRRHRHLDHHRTCSCPMTSLQSRRHIPPRPTPDASRGRSRSPNGRSVTSSIFHLPGASVTPQSDLPIKDGQGDRPDEITSKRLGRRCRRIAAWSVQSLRPCGAPARRRKPVAQRSDTLSG